MTHLKWIIGKLCSDKKSLNLGRANDRYVIFWYIPETQESQPEVTFEPEISLKIAAAVYLKYAKEVEKVN